MTTRWLVEGRTWLVNRWSISPTLIAKAPGEYGVRFETTAGIFVVAVERDRAPEAVLRP